MPYLCKGNYKQKLLMKKSVYKMAGGIRLIKITYETRGMHVELKYLYFLTSTKWKLTYNGRMPIVLIGNTEIID